MFRPFLSFSLCIANKTSLSSGRPGVGKTLTAEGSLLLFLFLEFVGLITNLKGIAEYLKRPLYMVGAGELGTSTHALEQQLSRILDVAHTWNAVLLLDEADVFLERRTMHDLQRNALVSIFLRLLEYFQGILFLTTNRVETFDEVLKQPSVFPFIITHGLTYDYRLSNRGSTLQYGTMI
jgi:SpoVK/Ycf46/Vps4 family AAA+-type ATPase